MLSPTSMPASPLEEGEDRSPALLPLGIPGGPRRVPSNAAIIPFKTLEQSDFRAPSNLNRWLKDGNEPHLDLLTAVLSER